MPLYFRYRNGIQFISDTIMYLILAKPFSVKIHFCRFAKILFDVQLHFNNNFGILTMSSPLLRFNPSGFIVRVFAALFVYFYFFLFNGTALAQNPGGVSGEVLWLKANTGVITSFGNVTNWYDQKAVNIFTVTGTLQYITDAVNFNPSVSIVSTNLVSELPTNRLDGNAVITGRVFFAVTKSNTNTSTLLGSTVHGNDYGPAVFAYDGTESINIGNGTNLQYKSATVTGRTGFQILAFDLGQNPDKFYQNSSSSALSGYASDFPALALTPMIGGTNNNGNSSGWKHFNGEVAELIVYNVEGLSDVDRNKIESYLALKYGISLGNNSDAIAYTNSSGTTVWASNAAYKYDIFGIGMDNGSGLNQTSSNSVNTGSGDGTGLSGKGNIVLSNPSSLNNGDFLILGNNGVPLSFTSLGLPAELSAYHRILRNWIVDITGDPGSVTLSFDMTGISGITVGGVAADYAILLDSDGNYTSGATKVDASSLNGNVITFTNLTLTDGYHFTFIGKTSALPVELTSFSGTFTTGKVVLNWETLTEVSNYGFEVERKDTKGEWQKIGFVPGSGNSNSPKSYSYEDKSFSTGKLTYRLKQVDTDGAFEYSPVVEVNADIPVTYELKGNYPNPFNPATTIEFGLPERGMAKLTVFNTLGEPVAELVNGMTEAGKHAITFDAANLPSGAYFYLLEAGKYVKTMKMLLVK